MELSSTNRCLLDLLFSEVIFILIPYKETKVFSKKKLNLQTLVSCAVLYSV